MGEQELIEQKIKKLEEMGREGIPFYPNTFRVSHSIAEILSTYKDAGEEELKSVETIFAVAGRLMRLNHFGKASFECIGTQAGWNVKRVLGSANTPS